MGSISALKLKNLRCFNDTGFVELKPITILVGRNSAGKSTFARILPLLRQSAEQDKRSPILWYGRLVDFGSFNAALNRNNQDTKTISISLKLDISKTPPSKSSSILGYSTRCENLEGTEISLELNLDYDESTNSTYASSILVEIFETKCVIEFNNSKTVKSITVNSLSWTPSETFGCLVSQKNINPSITYYRQIRRKINDKEITQRFRGSPFIETIVNHLRDGFHSKTKNSKIQELARSLKLDNKENIKKSLLTSTYLTPSAKKTFTDLFTDDSYIETLSNYLFADSLPEVIEIIDDNLADILSGVRYVEPLRATAQRYYRGQDLAVDEIDSKGTNVAMYIESLTSNEKEKLNSWLKHHFRVEVFAKNEGGHVAITLKDERSESATNIADLGVGFSQILPIALQLWQASQPYNIKRKLRGGFQNSCIIIEQPELHLHPAYQAKIADVMNATLQQVINDEERQLQIIAETHSPHLINRLGELISERNLLAESVQVILFEETKDGNSAEIRVAKFDDNGYLQNWPYGFFES